MFLAHQSNHRTVYLLPYNYPAVGVYALDKIIGDGVFEKKKSYAYKLYMLEHL